MSRKIIICKNCGLEKQNAGKGLCHACYKRQNLKICSSCGKLKPHASKGLCDYCYKKQNPIICKSCGELKPHGGRGLCTTCYQHNTGKSKPMNLNKSCSQYLGIVVAEELLSKIFHNVQRMPPNNKGFDFKCNKGMKIDVKAVC